jgi:flagellar hook-associated protein 3 FlgL
MASLDDSVAAKMNEVARNQERLTTGRRVNRSSDDASAFQRARQLESLQSRFEQFELSIIDARAWLDSTQENIDNLADVFAQAYEKGVRAVNSTLQPDEREDVAREIESLLQTTLDYLNAKTGDDYLHAGTRTTIKPFNIDPLDPTADGAGVVYYGNNEQIQRQIGPSSSLRLNIEGQQLIGVDHDGDSVTDFTVTESLQGFIDALRAGDDAAIKTGIDQIQASRNHFINRGAEMGALVSRINLSESQLADAGLILAEQRSLAEDTDYAETILDFQRAQSGLQTSLQITSSILQTSLLNFL